MCVRESLFRNMSACLMTSVLTMRGVTQTLVIRHADMGVGNEYNKQIRPGKSESVKMRAPERLKLESPECPAQRTKL